MSKVLTIAAREFRHTVLTKAFFIGSVVVPIALILVAMAAEVFLKPTIPPLKGPIAVIGGNAELVESIEAALAPPPVPDSNALAKAVQTQGLTDDVLNDVVQNASAQKMQTERPDTSGLTVKPVPKDQLEKIKTGIREGTWVAAMAIEPGTLKPDAPGGGRASLWFAPKAPPSHMDLLKSALRQGVVDTRLVHMGMSPSAVRAAIDRPSVSTMRIGTKGDERSESDLTRYVVPIGFMILMWMVTFTGGNYLLMSTIEEKSTKVMEVLLSAASPTQLLTGKIVGFAAVSGVMLSMYLIVAVLLLSLFAAIDLVSIRDLLVAGGFFIVAYLMIAAIMAGIGAAVSDITEAQSLMGPAMMILILPMLLMTVVTEAPNGNVAVVTSLIPPISPFIMVLRIAASPEPMPILEALAMLAWSGICAAGMIWAAGRIFRIGVLMQGKPPTPWELLKWIKYR
ncbi:MAG: ABC transporter permease [Phycisphaerales bacterium]|nr:ABC transporter permease [Phycisphaerales bacterium]